MNKNNIKAVIIADAGWDICKMDVSNTDILISLGDLDESKIQKSIERYSPKKAIGIKGNHDSGIEFYKNNIENLHLKVWKYKGITFGGFGGCIRYKDYGDWQYEEKEVETLIKHFPPVDVFIAHNSPFGIHDTEDHAHIGFKSFNKYIEKNKPKYFLHGHQHINKTTFLGDTEIICVYGEKTILLDF